MAKYGRLALKWTGNGVFLLFFLYHGVARAKGFYNVSEFKLNGNVIPYSPLDTLRWHDATFEDW